MRGNEECRESRKRAYQIGEDGLVGVGFGFGGRGRALQAVLCSS